MQPDPDEAKESIWIPFIKDTLGADEVTNSTREVGGAEEDAAEGGGIAGAALNRLSRFLCVIPACRTQS